MTKSISGPITRAMYLMRGLVIDGVTDPRKHKRAVRKLREAMRSSPSSVWLRVVRNQVKSARLMHERNGTK